MRGRKLLHFDGGAGVDTADYRQAAGAISVTASLTYTVWNTAKGDTQSYSTGVGISVAVSVVSGHIRGQTNTLPLHIEILYNEYQFAAAFAVASLLAALALVTLVLKYLVERQVQRELNQAKSAGVAS